MRPIANYPSIAVVHADALFVSAVQRSDEPPAVQVRQAIAAAVCRFGARGCAERVAQEFGDHPDIAAARMRWVRRQIAQAFAEPGLRAPAGVACIPAAAPPEPGPRRVSREPHPAGSVRMAGPLASARPGQRSPRMSPLTQRDWSST